LKLSTIQHACSAELQKTGDHLKKNTCLVEFFGFSKKQAKKTGKPG